MSVLSEGRVLAGIARSLLFRCPAASAWLRARRAMRVDPMVALRVE